MKKRYDWGWLFIRLFIVLAWPVTGVVLACRQAATPAVAEATYTASLLECIDSSATVEEARVCRAEVNARWHVDAGGGR